MPPTKAHRHWTEADREELAILYAAGHTAAEIGEKIGRGEGAVRQEMNRMRQRNKDIENLLDITEAQSSLVLLDMGFTIAKAGSSEPVTREELVEVIKAEPNGPKFLEEYESSRKVTNG